jgi:hypothetical protein
MISRSRLERSRRLVIAVAALSAIGLMTTPKAVDAGGISPGAAVGIGLGAFALGTAAGASAAPYYGYPGYYAPPPAYYYPPAPAYYAPPRSCWDPYYGRYYAC